ncbi:hypothetical protein G3R49_00905 [Shewanella sp. WXL01]|uniref:hypothetical protein n=1 Tax=Shewanella sp. WXL01 TaxID=2709721 RepID=UPI0014384089|nr:hypothetical protein [Shewanella sp. WXL01]NKF49134.1 hypothetical protein [Shewanella sp. WXL01]
MFSEQIDISDPELAKQFAILDRKILFIAIAEIPVVLLLAFGAYKHAMQFVDDWLPQFNDPLLIYSLMVVSFSLMFLGTLYVMYLMQKKQDIIDKDMYS